MKPMFPIIAGAMLLGAVGLLMWPLQRSAARSRTRLLEAAQALRELNAARMTWGQQGDRSPTLDTAIREVLLATEVIEHNGRRPVMYWGFAVLVIVSLAATAMYHWWGSPQKDALQSAHAAMGETAPLIDHGVDMQAAIAKLADKLKEHPDDAEGWALLGRTYKAMQQYPQAREAFKHAVQADPADANLAAEYESAQTPTPEPSMSDAPTPQACVLPGNDKAKCGDDTDSPAGADSSTRIVVNVSLDPQFKRTVRPNDTLFVFAKAAQGPPMPLAIARLTASQLPTTVTLTDGMSMIPSLSLSKFPQVILGARISKSGNAVAQSGDLQTLSAALNTVQAAPVRLTINHRVD